MNKLISTAAGLVLSLALGAAAFAQETPPAPTPDAPAPAAETAAPAVEQPTPEAAPAAPDTPAAGAVVAKGKIYFFRPGRLPGAIYTYHVVETGDDGKPAKGADRLGSLPNGGAFVLEVEPGIHSYNITGPMAVNLAEDRLRLEVEPGQTYYVEQTVRMGLVTGGFRLVPADEARFVKSKVKLKAAAAE
ncbi:hypothetical protein [Caulobacter mirabilis]|uniref:DUF2846 domain-containing protein n=1 Tax=Caulobacter mirabilis TaxID=69666 RepID=A0A2D2AX88_9CAUL|nr:hypothetical protein [Caulobacter mirabilis]ATQ42603.1 hypothetical protein CSW64_09385 [Caulobacter mirabilis]